MSWRRGRLRFHAPGHEQYDEGGAVKLVHRNLQMSSWLTGLCASIGAAFGIVEEHSEPCERGVHLPDGFSPRIGPIPLASAACGIVWIASWPLIY